MTYKKLLAMRYQDMADGLLIQKNRTLGQLAKAALYTFQCTHPPICEEDLAPLMQTVTDRLWCLNLLKRCAYPPLWVMMQPLCETDMPFLQALDEEDLGVLARYVLVGIAGETDTMRAHLTQQGVALKKHAASFLDRLEMEIPEKYAQAMQAAREAADIVVQRSDRDPEDAEYYALHIVIRLLVDVSIYVSEGEDGIALGVWLAQGNGTTEDEIADFESQLYGRRIDAPAPRTKEPPFTEEETVAEEPEEEDDDEDFISYTSLE